MRNSIQSGIDIGLLAPVIILVMLSLTTLLSISPVFFKSQLVFFILSIFAFLFFSKVNMRIVQLYKVPIYIISLLLLLIILIVGIESRGAIRWIEFFSLRIQFSEIIKPFLAISFAGFLSSRKSLSLKVFFQVFLFLLPIALLIFLQPDLGNAMIYFLITLLTLLVVGFPFRFFLVGFIPVILLIPILGRFLHGYQKSRLETFLHPGNDPLGTSYNAIQSVIAVGSGAFFGKGLGQGTQSGLHFLPERQTDFIFATITEGLGFVGALVILLSFAFLLYKIYSIFQTAHDGFEKNFSIIAFFIILVQFFINAGMNIGLLPIVGVTLPFVSYGGSSLLSNFILLGLLAAIRRNSGSQDVLEIQ